MRQFRLDYERYSVPEHTRVALEDYFFYGYEPGSFVTAVLCNDLMGTVNRCDHINRECIVDIAKWIMHNAPSSSWGSKQAVANWLADKDSCRTMYKDEWEKRAMWQALQEG